MNSAERIEKVLADLKITPYKLAKNLGFERADTVYNILKGRNEISRKFTYRLTMVYPEINAEWLLTGDGEMKVNKSNITTKNQQTGDNNYNQQTTGKEIIAVNEANHQYKVILELQGEVKRLKDLLEAKDKEVEFLRELVRGKPGQ